MLKILTGFIVCFALTSPIQAANVITFGKDPIVVFPHKVHQKKLGGCISCHISKTPGPFIEHTYQWGHEFCQKCHKKHKTAPVECSGCHSVS